MKTLALTSLVAVLMTSTAQAQLGGVAETTGSVSQQLDVSPTGLSGQTGLAGDLTLQPGMSRIDRMRLERAERAARRAARAASETEVELPSADAPSMPEAADASLLVETLPPAATARADTVIEAVPEPAQIEVEPLAEIQPVRTDIAVPAPQATIVRQETRPAYVSRETVIYTQRDTRPDPRPASTPAPEARDAEPAMAPSALPEPVAQNRSGGGESRGFEPASTGSAWLPLACGGFLIALLLALAAYLGRRSRPAAA